MFRATSLLAALLTVVGLALVLGGAKAQIVKGEGGVKDTRTSVGGCGGCSPSALQNCRRFVWYQRWIWTTGYSCSNCDKDKKDVAESSCDSLDQRSEDDLESWVLRNCDVNVECVSTSAQSSDISGGDKQKKKRFLLCDRCRFVDLKYTCTYDYLCTVKL